MLASSLISHIYQMIQALSHGVQPRRKIAVSAAVLTAIYIELVPLYVERDTEFWIGWELTGLVRVSEIWRAILRAPS